MSRNILPLSLPPEYRCVPHREPDGDPYLCGWELQVHTPLPKPHDWHVLAVRDTVEEIRAAYERIQDGEQP